MPNHDPSWERYRGRSVYLRVDANVPLENGAIANDARLRAIMPTLLALLQVEASVLLVTHLGRPKSRDAALSTSVIAQYLKNKFDENTTVSFLENWPETPCPYQKKVLYVAENVRFLPGELTNDEHLSRLMTKGADALLFEAFAVAHRTHASTTGAMKQLSDVALGPLFQRELRQITGVLKDGRSPKVAVVGGSKVETKIALLRSLLQQVDVLIVGGGLAHAFWKAQGFSIGQSLCDDACVPLAHDLLKLAKRLAKKLIVPVDAVVAKNIDASPVVVDVNNIPQDMASFDIGPKTQAMIRDCIHQASTVIWNGPLGVFERSVFAQGTEALVKAFKDSPKTYIMAGGGETHAVIDQMNAEQSMDYVSTAGGAFLYVLEHGEIPWLRETKGVTE